MAFISLPRTTLLVLCGVPGCGKSTFASRLFKDSAIVSSDQCRVVVSDSETNMAASGEAFRLFRHIIERRLSLGRFTVADSTALTRRARRELLNIGRKYGFNVTLLVFDLPEDVCLARNAGRERRVIKSVISKMHKELRRALSSVRGEGFDAVHVISEHDIIDSSFDIKINSHEVTLPGPFDIIGDVHGCCDELEMLLQKLGYRKRFNYYTHPEKRKAVFLGDITDRGPRSLDSFWLVKHMVDAGSAFYIRGNHCRKLCRYLEGRNVKIANGLEKTVAEINGLPEDEREYFREEFFNLYREAPPYLILDRGRLVVSHGGIKEEMIGEVTEKVRNFCFFGDVSGEVTEEGLPVRRDWAQDYSGEALIVYAHNPVPEAVFVNNTIDIDQGCAMGGILTALRYPELEIVQVPAFAVYYDRAGFASENQALRRQNELIQPTPPL